MDTECLRLLLNLTRFTTFKPETAISPLNYSACSKYKRALFLPILGDEKTSLITTLQIIRLPIVQKAQFAR